MFALKLCLVFCLETISLSLPNAYMKYNSAYRGVDPNPKSFHLLSKQGHCSAVAVKYKEKILILTAAHCVYELPHGEIEDFAFLYNGKYSLIIYPVGVDRILDLAVFKSLTGYNHFLPSKIYKNEIRAGEKVCAYGSTFGIEDQKFCGKIAHPYSKDVEYFPAVGEFRNNTFFVDFNVVLGVSGGGVFTEKNELIGIVSRISCSIRIDEILKFLDRLGIWL